MPGRMTNLRQRCPRCGDDMLCMYRKRATSSTWEWVWFCVTCRHEVTIPDEKATD